MQGETATYNKHFKMISSNGRGVQIKCKHYFSQHQMKVTDQTPSAFRSVRFTLGESATPNCCLTKREAEQETKKGREQHGEGGERKNRQIHTFQF
jgi:hypothetical protein